MAQLKLPPIPVKMYRHFAVVTIALTATLALFADGENAEIVAEHLAERERAEQLRDAEARRLQGPRVPAGSDLSPGSFAEDGGGFGAPTAPVEGGGGGGYRPPAGSPAAARAAYTNPNRPGGRRAGPMQYSQAYLDSLTEEQYQALMQGIPPEQRVNAAERQRQIDTLQRAGAQRAGGSGVNSDM